MKLSFDELGRICSRTRTSEGLRIAEGHQGYTADNNGRPIDLSELDCVVIHGMYSSLCDCFAELLSGYGIRATWATDNIGPYLTLPLERVEF